MVSPRVQVRPELYDYARERSGIDSETWEKRFPTFAEWRSGAKLPTLKQLQTFAKSTFTPLGFLLLPEPPVEPLPIADFRTVDNRRTKPDANLLDVIYGAQSRQEWYRDHQILHNEDEVAWVGALGERVEPSEAAERLQAEIGWGPAERDRCRTWEATLTGLREAAERAGVLVMIAGYAGSYTGRTLDPGVFRGFALVDAYAPVVFVNGADAKAAQIFTLAHELAHLLRGASGLSDLDPRSDIEVERWCNRTAAEFLIPADEFLELHSGDETTAEILDDLAAHFKVSTQAVLGRLRELGFVDWDRYFALRRSEAQRIEGLTRSASSGGDYRNSRPVQISKRFATELLTSVYEGQTSFTEAARLVGTSKESTLRSMGERLGVL
jgi:Zn-dependent peptidase ImmA (M78 family)